MRRPRLVFTAAVFDLLHGGHVNLLKKMRDRGDLVAVVLHDGLSTFNNKGKFPVDSLERRTHNLISTGLVDIVMHTYKSDPSLDFMNLFERYNQHFNLLFMRADDWTEFPGRNAIESMLIPIEIVEYTSGISSTQIRGEM